MLTIFFSPKSCVSASSLLFHYLFSTTGDDAFKGEDWPRVAMTVLGVNCSYCIQFRQHCSVELKWQNLSFRSLRIITLFTVIHLFDTLSIHVNVWDRFESTTDRGPTGDQDKADLRGLCKTARRAIRHVSQISQDCLLVHVGFYCSTGRRFSSHKSQP